MNGALLGLTLGLYALTVIGLGLFARRRSSRSPEEYFLAGRGLGTLVLFMALFGTNATSFVLVGIPARAYHDGIGTFGLNAPIVALGIPLTFWAIGSPARRMGRRLAALTPAELYARRFGSRAVGLFLFLFFTLYTLPYMVQAVKGAAVTLSQAAGGGVPEWAGGLAVTLLALVYTSLGGMRATAWTNVFQGALFLVLMVGALFFLAAGLGGFQAATEAVRERDPELLRIGGGGLFEPRAWASWGLVISLTVIGFPHMLARLMAGGSDESLRNVCRLYPLAMALLWVPAVMIGVWGAAAFPGLEGRESDRIFSLMTGAHLPAWLGPLGVVAVLAAVMSTLDAQILTLSSMLVRDVKDPYFGGSAGGPEGPGRSQRPGRADVLAGRGFAVLIGAAVFTLAQVWGASVFDISRMAFSGYVTLVPTLLLGVRWRRFTAGGAIASILVGNAVLAGAWIFEPPLLGFLPVFWALLFGTAAAVAGSLLGSAPDPARTAAAFGDAPLPAGEPAQASRK